MKGIYSHKGYVNVRMDFSKVQLENETYLDPLTRQILEVVYQNSSLPRTYGRTYHERSTEARARAEDANALYQLMGMINAMGPTEAFRYLDGKVMDRETIYKSPLFADLQEEEKEHMDNIRWEPDPVRGIFRCPDKINCGSGNVVSTALQKRPGDEGATFFIKCQLCGAEATING